MSQNEGNDNSQKDGKAFESGKKKVTLADATHILKAEAIRRLDLGSDDFETEGGEVEKEKDEAAREHGDGELSTTEGGSTDKIVLDKTDAGAEKPGGVASIENRDSYANQSTSQSGDQVHEVINNSGTRASGLGDGSIMEKGDTSESKETDQLSASKEPDFTTDPDRDTITKPNGIKVSDLDKNSADKSGLATRNKIGTAANEIDPHTPAQEQTASLLEEQETFPMSEEGTHKFGSSDLLGGTESAGVPAKSFGEDEGKMESEISGGKEQISSPNSFALSRHDHDMQQTDDQSMLVNDDRQTYKETDANTSHKDVTNENVMAEPKPEDGTKIELAAGDSLSIKGTADNDTVSHGSKGDSNKKLHEATDQLHEDIAPQDVNGVAKIDSDMSEQKDETVHEEDKMNIVSEEYTVTKTDDAANEEGKGKLLSGSDSQGSIKAVENGSLTGSTDNNLKDNEESEGKKDIHKDHVQYENGKSKDEMDLESNDFSVGPLTQENKGDTEAKADLGGIEDSKVPLDSSTSEQKEHGAAEDSFKEQSMSENGATDLAEKSNSKSDRTVDTNTKETDHINMMSDKENDGNDAAAGSETSNKISAGQGDKVDSGKENDADGKTGGQQDDKDSFKRDAGNGNQNEEGKGSQVNDEDGIENVDSNGSQNKTGESNQADANDASNRSGGNDNQGDGIKEDATKNSSEDVVSTDKKGDHKSSKGDLTVNGEKEDETGEKSNSQKNSTDDGKVDDQAMNNGENDIVHKPNENAEGDNEDPEQIDHTLPKDFYYNYEDIASKPKTTQGVPHDMFNLYHSFGFECIKRSNMHMLDAENIIFAAGNVVQILNIKSNEMKYIRTIGGGGIGAIAVHPSRKYFAVAEKGIKPKILIYEYPSLRVYRILRDGTELAYANLDFSPNGEKLASVGSAPDYMLTVWDWINENIELRSKAFSQDIYKVAFSPENEGHLCTSGTGHIRFWIMADTFTGLKLQGELGRFGTTELSDIAGFVELPDGKVLSGSEWGNMLLWDGGLIKAEIARKGKKTCHHGMIMEFFLDEGELITIGADGYVKVWDFESIDTAEASEESKIFEMEPMSELKVGSDVKLVSMVKSVNPTEASIWYAQDGSGGIWKLDLSFSHTSQAPKRLYSFHSGSIEGLAVSNLTHLSATVGSDHTVRLYDYLAKNQVCYSRYTAPGTSIIWMPTTADPDGLSILAGFQDGVIRQLTVAKKDQNSVATKKDTTTYELKLVQVFKPHVKAVTALAVSHDGKFLATGSDDATVFFFSIDKKYKPIGFIETEGAIASLDWSSAQEKNTLLVCGKDGNVLEISCPSADDYDTSKTFLIPIVGLKRSEFKFKSIKDKLVKEEDDLRKAKEEEERRKKKEEERRKRKERGIVEEEEEEEEEENGEGEGNEEEGEDPPKEEEMHELGQIVNGFYKGETGNFWLLLDGWDAGYIYECAFTDDITAEPIKAVKFEEIDDIPVRSYCFSKTKQYMALGLDNGSVRVQLLDSRDISKLNSYWSHSMHDNHYGAVTNISLSFDERFLLSVGSDGNFFVYSFMEEEKLKSMLGKQMADIVNNLDSTKISRIDDIEDPNHYSIELEKQKAEYDRTLRLAEEKKQQTRQTINLLRIDFKRLLSRNQDMPPYLQLPSTEFEIDPKMKDDVDAETKAKLKLVEQELAWESERQKISLQKLKTRFKDTIECELFRLHSFKLEHSVSSYRATVLPPEFNEALEGNRNGLKSSKNGRVGIPAMPKRASTIARKVRPTSVEESAHEEMPGDGATLQSVKSKPAQKLDGKIAKAIEKAEQKRKRRMERKAKWDELYQSKPDADYEDPAIVAAIKEAQENMGDFKLKSADDYIVPEKERVNADKKRTQIMLLKEQIHQLKANFNEKLLNLRNEKMTIIAEVKCLIDQLENVQNELPLAQHAAIPPVPMMHPEEQPEARFEYTPEILERFKKELDDGEQTVKIENPNSFGGGFGGFGAGEQTHQPGTKITSQLTSIKTDPRGRSTSILSTLSSQPRSGSSAAVDHGSPETISEEVMIDDVPSDMELKVRHEQKIRLIYRRDSLLQKIKDLLKAFDAELRLLRHEKIHLDVDLKNADLRMITLFEEFVLLKEFEKRENLLMGKVSQKMQEKSEMEEKVDDCEMKLQVKRGDIEKLLEKEKSLSSMFSSLFLESNKFEAFLTKVYKKKVKRAKKTEKDDGSDEDSDEELSDDDYDSEEDEDSDAEELDDSVCPPGCDQAMFDQVCQLRERRLDLEEAMVEEKKAADTLKKELDALKKKAKVIESNLVSAEADLEAFQREKQQKLNELDIVVTLKLNQVQYLNNNALPQDLSQCLVFTSTALDRLQRRITELDKEKADQKRHYWKLRQQHVQLIRDKKSMEEKISQLEEKVKQMQLLKFGRLVDLEKLETVSVNRAAEELKEQLRAQEFSNAKEIAAWEKRIDDTKAKLTQVTRENTQRLDTFTRLLQEKKELEQTLDSRQKSLGGEFQGNRQADYQERQRLIQLVQLQSQEIEALKDEIGLLSRKGGHILPPSQARVSNATPAAR